jgi:hypothetical protein
MNYDQNDCQQFYFITPRFSDTPKHTKNKSWRRCRLYFRGRSSVGGFLILKQIIVGILMIGFVKIFFDNENISK